MPGLKILLTNTHLIHRGGTELYIRDLATALLRFGHKPSVYSPRLGGVAEEIRALGIPAVDALDALAEPPDLIHGQHHLETMAALWRFPDAPALYVSHGSLPWQEAPPLFPRILQYVVVGINGRDRLTREFGIDPDRVSVVHNFVDLERFRPRTKLSARPRRALLFGNWPSEAYRDAVSKACADRSITLDLAGHGLGAVTDRPEALLHHYDLVFAVGRSALEAMATGAAVILASPDGLGPLVTTANFDRLRSINFGIRALTQPCDPPSIAAAIDRYDPAEASLVSQAVVQTAGLDAAVDRIVGLYEEVLTRWRATTRDRAAEERASSAYLQWFSRTVLPGIGKELRKWEEIERAQHARSPLPADGPTVSFDGAAMSPSPAASTSGGSGSRAPTAFDAAGNESETTWRPLLREAMAALDDGRPAEGHAACLALLADVGLPEDVRDLVYAIQAELAQPLAAIAPSATGRQLRLPAADDAILRDPSPIGASDGLRILGRTGRADSDDDPTYNDVLLTLDVDLAITDIAALTDETGMAERFAEVRPFLRDGLLHAAFLLDDPDGGLVQAGIAAIADGAYRNPRVLGPRAGSFRQGWAPIPTPEGPRFLSWWEPTEVMRFDVATGAFTQASLRRASHAAERFWSGSPGVAVPGGYLLLVNESAGLDDAEEETSTTRFTLLDAGFRLVGVSPPFFVADRGIDVATGLALRDDRLVAGFTSGEASALLVTVDLAEALSSIKPIGAPGRDAPSA